MSQSIDDGEDDHRPIPCNSRHSRLPPTATVIEEAGTTVILEKKNNESVDDGALLLLAEKDLDQMINGISINDLRKLVKRTILVLNKKNDDTDALNKIRSEIIDCIQQQQHQQIENNNSIDDEAHHQQQQQQQEHATPLIFESRSYDMGNINDEQPSRGGGGQQQLQLQPEPEQQRHNSSNPSEPPPGILTVSSSIVMSSSNSRPQQQQRQLVVLCNRKPHTPKECNDQDLAMKLCKKMGIIPRVVLSSISSVGEINEETKNSNNQGVLLIEAMMIHAANSATAADPPAFVNNDTASSSNSNNDGIHTITYPQFFLCDAINDDDDDDDDDDRTNNNETNSMPIEYKGDYDIMEKLYNTSSFSSESLSIVVQVPTTTTICPTEPMTATTANDTNTGRRAFLGDFEKPIPQCRRKDEEEEIPKQRNNNPNLLSSSDSRLIPLLSPQSGLQLQQPTVSSLQHPLLSSSPELSTITTTPITLNQDSHHITNTASNHPMPMSQLLDHNSKESLLLANSNDNDNDDSSIEVEENSNNTGCESSYSHLDGLNQPKQVKRNSIINSSIGELSLGDDLRMIFDTDDTVNTVTSTVKEENGNSTAVGVATVAAGIVTIQETDDEDDDNDDKDNDPDDEDNNDQEESNRKRIDNDATVPKTVDSSQQPNYYQDQHQGNNRFKISENSDVTRSISSTTGRIIIRESVTLKSAPPPSPPPTSISPPLQHRRPQQEPPGTTAATAVNRAKNLLKPSPPSSASHKVLLSSSTKPSSATRQQRKNNNKKKLRNPYYALNKYSSDNSSAGDDNDVREVNTQSEPKKSGKGSTIDRQDNVPKKVIQMSEQSWMKKFNGIRACYLVFNSCDKDEDKLDIYYSENPMQNAVGVWTSKDIGAFKKMQGLSNCERIGTCASHVTRDYKNYCQGWCQFIKAAKNMDGTVTVLPHNDGLAILPVDFYLHQNGSTIKVSVDDDDDANTSSFGTEYVDAIACVPKYCNFPISPRLVGKKWCQTAKKLGAVVIFKRFSSSGGGSSSTSVSSSSSSRTGNIGAASNYQKQAKNGERSPNVGKHKQHSVEYLEEIAGSTVSVVYSSPIRNKDITEQNHIALESVSVPAQARAIAPEPASTEKEKLVARQIPCPDGGACYLVYDPDSSGCLVEHYSKDPVEFAIGRWVPGPKKKIAGFKFKRNVGRNVLIQNCSAGVQGRKSYCSGWCQFFRSAMVMNGEVVLYDPVKKGLMVDVYLYYNDPRPNYQTIRMEQAVPYTTENVLAVSCIPKGTPFFECMRVDLILWLAEGSKFGYSSKM